jgi:hypothetical protein
MTGVETWQLAAAARFVTTACCKKLRNPCLSILWHSGCKNHDMHCSCVTEVCVRLLGAPRCKWACGQKRPFSCSWDDANGHAASL